METTVKYVAGEKPTEFMAEIINDKNIKCKCGKKIKEVDFAILGQLYPREENIIIEWNYFCKDHASQIRDLLNKINKEKK